MGFAALSIDVGMVLTVQTELQNVADAAAYAGIARLVSGDYYSAVSDAVRFGNINTVQCLVNNLSASDIELGTYDFNTHVFTAAPLGVPAGSNAIRVVASRNRYSINGPLRLMFGSVLGRSSTDVQASTISALDRRVTGFDGSIAGVLLPFAVNEAMVGTPPVLGRVVDMYPNHDQWNVVPGGPIQTAPGNFGLLDLAGGAGSPGTPTIRDWIDNGYPGIFEIPPSGSFPMEGAPGLRNTIGSNVLVRAGQTVLVLVHNGVSGSGSNSVYNIVGLLAVRILFVTGNGSNLHMYVQVVEYASSGFITGPGGVYNTSVAKTTLVQ